MSGQKARSVVFKSLVPGIHVYPLDGDVDGRDKPGHDEVKIRIAGSHI
jgi:hypothetical protein